MHNQRDSIFILKTYKKLPPFENASYFDHKYFSLIVLYSKISKSLNWTLYCLETKQVIEAFTKVDKYLSENLKAEIDKIKEEEAQKAKLN